MVPTALPLERFYEELVRTQAVINRRHLGPRTALGATCILGRNLLHGQSNFTRMLWKFNQVYNPRRQLADRTRPVRHELPLPRRLDVGDHRQPYVHTAVIRKKRPRAPRRGLTGRNRYPRAAPS